jgi:hypothetical protein
VLTPSTSATRHASNRFTRAADYNIPSTQQQESAAQKKAADKAAELTDKVGDAAIALGAAVIGYGALTGPGEAVAGTVGLGIVAFGAGMKVGSAIGKFLWGDPFKDKHFKLIARPRGVNIGTIGGTLANAVDIAATKYLVANLKLAELGQAYQTSINRALGAHAAHNKKWTVRQLNTAAGYAKRGANLFLSLHGLRSHFASAVDSTGFGTVVLPQTSQGARKAGLSTDLGKLPKALYHLFNFAPLKGHKLSKLLAPLANNAPTGAVGLDTVFQSAALDKAEDALAGHLRTFAQIVKHTKAGHVPAGL